MSATNRGMTPRRPGDRYMTPAPLARAICDLLSGSVGDLEGKIIWEPSAGTGSFVDAALRTWPKARIVANDPKLGAGVVSAPIFQRANATMEQVVFEGRWVIERPALIIGNPPFRMAVEHVQLGLSQLGVGGTLAFLMRLNLLGSFTRVDFWRKNPPSMVTPIIPRPSFTGGGSDATEYALFVWKETGRGLKSPARISPPLVWREP